MSQEQAQQALEEAMGSGRMGWMRVTRMRRLLMEAWTLGRLVSNAEMLLDTLCAVALLD